MSIAEQFAGLDMESLIGGPLTEAEDDSNLLTRSTANFHDDMCIDADGKDCTMALENEKRSANDDGAKNLEEKKVDVPMLAIAPIPGLQVDEVDVHFDMEVKQSGESGKVAAEDSAISFACIQVKEN